MNFTCDTNRNSEYDFLYGFENPYNQDSFHTEKCILSTMTNLPYAEIHYSSTKVDIL